MNDLNEAVVLEAPHQAAAEAAPAVPKYIVLRNQLLAAIRDGRYRPGDKLPTEAELTRMTPYSLATVQRALRALVDEGLIVRTQGSGTFVAQGRLSIGTPTHLRFLGEAGEPPVLPLFPEGLERERVAEPGPWSGWLGPDAAIVRLDRRLSVNGEFHIFNRFYFDARVFPAIAAQPLAELEKLNARQLVASALEAPITIASQRLSWVKLAAAIARLVDAKAGTPGMLLESQACAGRDKPVYFLESYIPPNARKLDLSVS